MTVVIDEKGEGHAVLTLITSRGDLILDNKTNAVLPWTQTGYTFVKRESQDARCLDEPDQTGRTLRRRWRDRRRAPDSTAPISAPRPVSARRGRRSGPAC